MNNPPPPAGGPGAPFVERRCTPEAYRAGLAGILDMTTDDLTRTSPSLVDLAKSIRDAYPNAVSLKASWVGNGASDSVVQNGVSQPQYKRAFRMSALEDFVDLDDEDGLPCNGIVSPPLVERREQLEAHLTNSKPSSAGELKLVKSTIQQEVKSPSEFASSTSSELKGTSMVERNNGVTTPTSEETTVAAQSVALLDKPKQTNDPPVVFSFSSKVADEFPSLTPESSSRTPETKPESSSSLFNISAPTDSPVELDNGGHMKSLAAEDGNRKSDTVPSASSNEPLVPSASVGLFAAASFNNANPISTSGPAIFTPSTSVSTVGTGDITSATSSSSIIWAVGGSPFKFGGSSDPPAQVSIASTIQAGDLKTGAVKDSSADSIGTVSQGTSVLPFSFAPPPSAPSVSSLSSSQVFSAVTPFGFNSSASSSGSGATSSIFGVNPAAVSDGSSASSSSMSSFGLNSSSSSTNAVGPTGGAAPPVFSFGSSSSVSASASTFSTTSVASAPAPAQANPFQFGGQQNQVAPQNPPLFQASGSLEFNAGGGSFSFGSCGGDKSGLKFLKVNRSKNRKK